MFWHDFLELFLIVFESINLKALTHTTGALVAQVRVPSPISGTVQGLHSTLHLSGSVSDFGSSHPPPSPLLPPPPPAGPCLLKSQSASAAPAASDCLAAGRRCLLRTKTHTHTHRGTGISQARRGSAKNDNNSKKSTSLSSHSPSVQLCIAALSTNVRYRWSPASLRRGREADRRPAVSPTALKLN